MNRLIGHCSSPAFVFRHEWQAGDCVVYDNRVLMHSPTWFDAKAARREMWRTTVSGNPGAPFDGDASRLPSWATSARGKL